MIRAFISNKWHPDKKKRLKYRKRKAFFSLIAIILLTVVINSYMKENEKEIDFPENFYGIPTYQNSKLSYPMSSLNGDPCIAVFLTEDPYEKVLRFYQEKLKTDYKTLDYGHMKRNLMTMTIYQFEMEKGVLEDYINKGVEIIPFNSWNQKIYKAKTKIKIILPRKEIVELNKKKETPNR